MIRTHGQLVGMVHRLMMKDWQSYYLRMSLAKYNEDNIIMQLAFLSWHCRSDY